MYCQHCGSALSQDASFCQSCGRPQSLPKPPSPPVTPAPTVQTSQQKPKPKIVWLVVGGIVLLVIIIGMFGKSSSDKSDNSTSTTTQQSSTSIVEPQVTRPSIPPPKFRIYKFKNDGISPTSVVVPTSTTDEQLKSLIWFFREKVRSHDFKSLGLKEQKDGTSRFIVARSVRTSSLSTRTGRAATANTMTLCISGESAATTTMIQGVSIIR